MRVTLLWFFVCLLWPAPMTFRVAQTVFIVQASSLLFKPLTSPVILLRWREDFNTSTKPFNFNELTTREYGLLAVDDLCNAFFLFVIAIAAYETKQ